VRWVNPTGGTMRVSRYDVSEFRHFCRSSRRPFPHGKKAFICFGGPADFVKGFTKSYTRPVRTHDTGPPGAGRTLGGGRDGDRGAMPTRSAPRPPEPRPPAPGPSRRAWPGTPRRDRLGPPSDTGTWRPAAREQGAGTGRRAQPISTRTIASRVARDPASRRLRPPGDCWPFTPAGMIRDRSRS
jgi:hypothetical protein